MSKRVEPLSGAYEAWIAKYGDGSKPRLHAFDVETYLITPGNPTPKMVCLSFASENGDTGVLLREEGLDWIEAALIAGDHLIAHNARFDLSVCAVERPRLIPLIYQALREGRIHDTGLRQKILDNAKGELKYEFNEETGEYKAQKYALADLCWRLLRKWRFGDKEGDVWRLRYYTLDGIPVEEWPKPAIKYSLEDSVDALEIFLLQEDDYHADLLQMEWSQCQPDWALQLMSMWGSRTNEEDIDILEADFKEKHLKQAQICIDLGLAHWKKTKGVLKVSRKMAPIYDLVRATYEEHGISVPMTEGGKGKVKKPQVSTSRDTLLMREYPGIEPHPGMKAVSEFVRIGKLLSTYIPMLRLGTRLPINPRYNCILETYRTSCSGPNIQNVSKDGGIRNCWEARPGYVYGFCDFDTVEMRTLAQVCIWLFGHSKIAEAIKEGKDLHCAFAAEMLDIPYEKAMELLDNEDPTIVESRQGSKIANYGMAGGMGPHAFVEYARGFGVEISIERARELHQGFRAMWPEMIDYFAHCAAMADDKDKDLGINQIEFFVSGLIRGDVPYCAIANGYFQNLAAMGAKKALFEVSYLCYVDKKSPLFGCRPWLFAHDEIGLEVPFDGSDIGRARASKAMKELERVMIECMKYFVPDVPIGATAAMCFTWIKGAKPVYREIDGERELVPSVKEGREWIEDYARDAA
jgi:hypothetical protein